MRVHFAVVWLRFVLVLCTVVEITSSSTNQHRKQMRFGCKSLAHRVMQKGPRCLWNEFETEGACEIKPIFCPTDALRTHKTLATRRMAGRATSTNPPAVQV